MATTISPQAQFDLANKQIKGNQAKVKLLTSQKAYLKKPDPRNVKATAAYKAQVAKYTAQIKQLNASIAVTQKSLPALQNKVWESTGQYDKLLTGTHRDAYMALESLFKNYGLESLAGKIYGYIKNGESSDTISIQLQDTPEYKARFAGNELRKKAGLPVLSPAQYLSTESSYKQIMQQAGMPIGFYDQNSDFNNWIGKDVSPSEIQGRVDLASQATTLASPDFKKALNQMGIDDGHLAAYFLDQKRSLPFLTKAAATASIGAQALAEGLAFDQSYSEQLATSGVTQSQAQQGYQNIATGLPTLQSLGAIYGGGWTQREGEQAEFGGSPEAVQKRGRLLSQERGAFSGSVGGAVGGLGQEGGAR